jgi:Fe-S cluster assembly protein SufD
MEIIMIKEDKHGYLEGFAQFEKRAPGSDLPWLQEIRQDAITAFAELGFPTLRDEDWRFTNLAPLVRTSFRLVEDGRCHISPREIEPFIFLGLEYSQLVFVDGRYSPDISSLNLLPNGVKVSSLVEALTHDRDLIEEYLSRYADYKKDVFVALNTAFMEDGAFVYIPRGVILEEPIHLLYVTATAETPAIINPRNLIVMEESTQATIVEHYTSLSDNVYFSNVVTEVVVGKNSVLNHCIIERESKKAFNISTLRVQQDRSSSVTANSLLFGGSLVRNNVHSVLAGEGSECYINGLFMATGRQHMDNYMKIEHASPHCDSRQLYKGILDGRSHGVFHGRIIVHKGAQKTDAKQTNRNLLLSDDAQIDTKPQLEIYADDVKCTHGATIGQLDENAIFYLRSRGIPLDSARALLLFAFTREILERIKVEPIRNYLEKLVTQWFIEGKLIEKTG